MNHDNKGFTLVEMLVTMAVFVVVIAITGSSFNAILSHSSKLFRSEESNIEGMVGLEILRHDIQQAGLGLFTEPMTSSYSEAAAAPASVYNDASSNVPRPIIAGNNIAAVTDTSDTGGLKFDLLPGSDYLAIKAVNVGRNRVSQKWTYLHYTSNDVYPNTWRSAAENFSNNDRVVLIRRQMNAANQTVTVQSDRNGDYYHSYSNSAFSHLTSLSSSLFTVYGLDSSPTTPRMPFNRSDYFVSRPQDSSQVPPVCAPNSGILYKTTVNQSDGKLNYVPILDCVADMQIVLGWDINGDSRIDTYSNADGSQVSGIGTTSEIQTAITQSANNSSTTFPNIRNSLKMIKVYILAQQGRSDPGYTSASPIIVGETNESALTRSFDVAAAGWLNYRWKLYRIIAQPKNLPANQ